MKLKWLLYSILFSSTVVQAGSTTFQYEHNWKEHDRRKSDSIKLIQKTDSGWGFEFKFGATAGGNDSNHTQSYDDMEGGSGGVVIQYNYKLDDNWGQIQPSMEFGFSKNKTLFQPGLKYSYKITKDWSTELRYRYEFNKISQSERDKTATISSGITTDANGKQTITKETVDYIGTSDTGRHRINWLIAYSGFEKFNISYNFNYYIGKNINTSYSTEKSSVWLNGKEPSSPNWTSLVQNEYSQFKHKKIDYAQEIKITYLYSKQFRPYLELDEISRNKDNSQRHIQYKIGFNYTF